MTSVVAVMAAALDHELRRRFNFCLCAESCADIMRAVIARSAAAGQVYESSQSAQSLGREPDGGCIAGGGASDASTVAFLLDQSPSSADLAPLRTSDGGRAPSDAAPAVTAGSTLRAGDIVHHEPTGEDWVVAYVDGEYLAWCGWPAGEARLSDCRLTKPCSDEEHIDWLRQIAKAEGKRARRAQLALAALDAAAGPEGEGTPMTATVLILPVQHGGDLT